MDEEYCRKYGPYALVTGASSGIGWAFAEELARRGLRLVLSARRVDRLEALAGDLEARFGTQSVICQADLAEPAAPGEILAATAGLDVGLVVSNAGFNMKGPHEAKSASSLAKLLTVNCHAPTQLAHGFIPRLKERGKGGIIFTSSVEGLLGVPYSAAYSSSKALLVALGEALWGELAGSGVDVLTLCPGATESESMRRRPLSGQDMQTLQAADEVAIRALDNIAHGPTYIPSEKYKAHFDELRAQPRQRVLLAMAGQLREVRPGN